MRCSVLSKETNALTLEVALDGREVGDLSRNCYIEIAQEAGLSPQKGRTSREVVEDHFGSEETARRVTALVVYRAAPLALDMAEVDAVGCPSFVCSGYAEPGFSYSFSMTVVVMPCIELSSYGPVTLAGREVVVEEAEVDEFIGSVAHRHPDCVVDETANVVCADSIVRLSMETVKEGFPYDPLCFSEKEYRLGRADMPRGFDEGLVGMTVGQTKEIAFAGPDPASPFDTEGHFNNFLSKVRIIAIVKVVEPIVDDSWVSRNISGCATVREMRERAAREIKESKLAKLVDYEKYCAANEIAQRLIEPIPDEIFVAALKQMLDEHRRAFEERGVSREEYFDSMGFDEKEFEIRAMRQVREHIKQRIALDAVARREGFEATERDLDVYLGKGIDGKYKEKKEALKAKGGLFAVKKIALRVKTNEWLVDHAIRLMN